MRKTEGQQNQRHCCNSGCGRGAESYRSWVKANLTARSQQGAAGLTEGRKARLTSGKETVFDYEG